VAGRGCNITGRMYNTKQSGWLALFGLDIRKIRANRIYNTEQDDWPVCLGQDISEASTFTPGRFRVCILVYLTTVGFGSASMTVQCEARYRICKRHQLTCSC
jgi:hypothetical protein